MDIRDLHCIVIGAGVGGLAAAALLARQGIQVTVLEAQSAPGGCAGRFISGGFRFDSGATVGCGFHPGGPLDRLGHELGIEWPVTSVPVAWQYRRRGRRLDLGRSRDGIVARFPRSASFWEEQASLAGMLWRFAEGGLQWPSSSLSDLVTLTMKGIGGLPDTFMLGKFATRTAHDWLASHGLDTISDFVRFIDAQLLISVQTTSREANALSAAIALDLPASGTWQVRGGIGRIAELLAASVEKDGGAVLCNKRVIRLDTIRREVLGVETADGDALAADIVVANLTPDTLEQLDSVNTGRGGDYRRPGWSAFMLYLGMDSRAFSRAGVDHLQIVSADGAFGECRSLFLSASPAGDLSRAPRGLRAVTLSTHTRPEPWFEALRSGRDAYLRLKEQYTRQALDLLYAEMPEAEGCVRSVMAATPVSWERWTGRRLGQVGGYAQTSLFEVSGPATRYDNLFLAGDSIFPGQSLPGVVTGARRCVELALRRARKISL